MGWKKRVRKSIVFEPRFVFESIWRRLGLVGNTGTGRSALVAELYKKFAKKDGKLSKINFYQI